MRNWLPFAVTCCLTLGAGALAADAEFLSTKLTLTHDDRPLRSAELLFCEQRVQAFLTLPEPLIGSHRLESLWARPDGKVAARAMIPLHYPAPGRRSAQLWLDAMPNGSGDGLLGPAVDRSLLHGRWSLELRLDGAPLITQSFSMQCP